MKGLIENISRIFLFPLTFILSGAGFVQACPPAPSLPTAAQMSALQAQATDHGFLWKISKNNHVSWLYGTLHLGKKEWIVPGPQTLNALRQSQTVALELDLLDPGIQQKLAALSATIRAPFPADLASRMKKQLESHCLPPTTLTSMHPALAITSVTGAVARDAGLEPAFAIDGLLAGFAHSAKKQVVSLETPEQQLALLTSDNSGDLQQDLDEALTQLETGKMRNQLIALADAWATHRYDLIDAYPSWCECMDTPRQRTEMQHTVFDRNQTLAASIAALHARGQSVFGAVGSLHMVGTNGIPALLKKQGFDVERVF